MTGMKKIAAALAAAGLLASGPAQATLLDRGGGLIYDSVLDITWLQDANYAKTSGFDADGRMNWSAANAWAAGLNYFDSVRGVTWSDWRLPITTDLGTPGCDFSYGGTECGFNVATSSSEMAHLFFVDLGNLSVVDTAGVFRGGSSGVDWGVVNTGLFDNLQSYVYWSGTAYAPDSASGAWFFGTINGLQYDDNQGLEFFAWAVRPGDVAALAVPEPMSLSLLGLGLAGMAVARRRRTVCAGRIPPVKSASRPFR